MKKYVKTILVSIALILACLMTTGCKSLLNTKAYSNTTFKVVEAETGEPIAGAVLLVQWTKPSGFSSAGSTNYKVVEVQSDQNGMLSVPGAFRIGLDAPRLVVYKRGYVAWSNEFIFPDYKRRTDFKWRNGYAIGLERFKPEYSRNDHVSFLDGSNSAPRSGLLRGAYRWEAMLKHR